MEEAGLFYIPANDNPGALWFLRLDNVEKARWPGTFASSMQRSQHYEPKNVFLLHLAELELLDVYVAAIAAHQAACILSTLTQAAPMPAHMKRVRRLPPPPHGGDPQLDVILCLASPAADDAAPVAGAELLPSQCLPDDPDDGRSGGGAGERRSEDEDWLHSAPPAGEPKPRLYVAITVCDRI